MASMGKQGVWTEFWSKRKNRPFYVNEVTGEKCWSIPDEDEAPGAAMDALPEAPRDNESQQESPGLERSSETSNADHDAPHAASAPHGEAGRQQNSAFEMDDEHAPAEDEVLEELGILAKSHDELEKKVIKKLEDVVKQKEAAENQKQVEMQTQVIEMLQGNIKRLEEKLANPAYSSEFQQSVLKEQLDEVREKLRKQTLAAKQVEHDEREKKQDKAKTMFVKAIEIAETERDRMIRTGKLTPFAGKEGAEKVRLQHSQVEHASFTCILLTVSHRSATTRAGTT